jgi:hypothetical protein
MRIILIILVFIAFGQQNSAYGESPVLDFIFEGPYTLQADEDKASINIPVRMAKGIKIEKLTASFGKMDPSDVSKAFTASLVPERDQMHAQLKLEIDLQSIQQEKRYGKYNLVLDVSHPVEKEEKDQAGNKRKVKTRELKIIKLELQYPETKVYTPQPLLVSDTWIFWGHYGSATSPLSLEVEEGPVFTSLSAYQTNPAKIGNDPVIGRLKLKNPNFLNDGRIARVPVEVETGFPIGDASGTIQMAAPGMQRTEVAFTVKTRQHKMLIPIIAGIGLFIGFVLRTRLESRIENRQNKINLQRLLLRVQNAQGLGKEATFSATLTKLAQDIEAEIRDLKTTPSNNLPEKMTKLGERLKSALTDFTNKQNAIAQRFNDSKALLSAKWRVPPSAKPKGDLTSVQIALDSNDIDEATKLLAEFDNTQSKVVITSLETWYNEYQLHFSDLGNVSPPLPESAVAMLQSEPLPLKQKIPAQGQTDLAVIRATLEKADQDYQLIVGLVESTRKVIYRVAGRVKQILSKDKYKDGDLQKLTHALENLALTNSEQAVDDPNPGFKNIAAAFQVVTNEMNRLIVELHPQNNLPAADKTLLDGGQYEEAAAQAPIPAAQAPVPAARAPVPHQLGAAAQVPGLRVLFAPQPAIKPAPHAKGPTVPLKMPPEFESLEAQIQRTWKEIASAKAFQSFGASLGLILIAYLIFADTFIGYPADFMKIFFWGFTTDIGVNVLLEKATSATTKK